MGAAAHAFFGLWRAHASGAQHSKNSLPQAVSARCIFCNQAGPPTTPYSPNRKKSACFFPACQTWAPREVQPPTEGTKTAVPNIVTNRINETQVGPP